MSICSFEKRIITKKFQMRRTQCVFFSIVRCAASSAASCAEKALGIDLKHVWRKASAELVTTIRIQLIQMQIEFSRRITKW